MGMIAFACVVTSTTPIGWGLLAILAGAVAGAAIGYGVGVFIDSYQSRL